MRHVVVTCIMDGQETLLNRCIASVRDQDVNLSHRIFIDDCRQEIAPMSITADSIMLSFERKGALYGIFSLLKNNVTDDDLIHIVDGDDMLTAGALERRERIFESNPALVVCWGGYRHDSGAKPKFSKRWEGKEPRKIPWTFSHLKSFRYKVYKNIPLPYLQRENKFFMTCADIALMYPMMEMAGRDRCLCDDKQAIYIYNDISPFNDHRMHKSEQQIDEVYIRSMLPLQRREKI